MENLATGATSLSTMVGALPQEQARTSILQSQAELFGMDVAGKKAQAAEQAKIMEEKAGKPPLPVPKVSPASAYGNYEEAVSIAKEEQDLDQRIQERQRVIDAGKKAGGDVSAEQKELDMLETRKARAVDKRIQIANDAIAGRMYSLDNTSPENYSEVREFDREQFGKHFDSNMAKEKREAEEAEAAGFPRPMQKYNALRKQYIDNSSRLPETFSQAAIDAEKARGGSAKTGIELLKLKRSMLQEERKNKEQEAREADRDRKFNLMVANIGGRESEKLIAEARKSHADALKANTDEMKSLEREIGDIQKNTEDLQNPLKTTIPPQTKGGIFGFGKEENPDYTAYKTMLDNNKTLSDLKQKRLDSLRRERDTLNENQKYFTGKLGERTGTKKPEEKVDVSKFTGQDRAAYEWAVAHKDDSRADAIFKKLGIK